MKKLLKRVLLGVLSLALILNFAIGNVQAFEKPTPKPMTWPGNYNPKPGQEDGAYSFPGLYEPYYLLDDFNYAQWLRDYTEYSSRKNKARGECLIELIDLRKATTYVGLVGGAKKVTEVIKFGAKKLPLIGLGAYIIDYNVCMANKGF